MKIVSSGERVPINAGNGYGTVTTESNKPQNNLPEVVKDTKDISQEKLNEAVGKINKTVLIFNKSLHFVVHEESKRWMVQVIDKETGEVLREIPPKEILDIVAKLNDIVGLLVDVRR